MRRISIPLAVLGVGLLLPSAAYAQSPAPASPAPSPAASAAPAALPTADPAITARAKDWFKRIQTANFDRSQLAANANAALTDTVAKGVAAQLGPLGEPTSFEYVDTRKIGDNTAYTYRVAFASTAIYYVFVLDPAGKISGLRLVPAS